MRRSRVTVNQDCPVGYVPTCPACGGNFVILGTFLPLLTVHSCQRNPVSAHAWPIWLNLDHILQLTAVGLDHFARTKVCVCACQEHSWSGGRGPCLEQPIADFLINIRGRIQLQMVDESPAVRLNDLLPTHGWVFVMQSNRENKRSAFAPEIFTWHPRPGKSLTPAKRDLALRHTNFHRPQGFDYPPQGVEESS